MNKPHWFDMLPSWRKHYQAKLDAHQLKVISKCAIINRVDDMGGTAGVHAGNHHFHVIALSRFLNVYEAKLSYGHEFAHLLDGVLNNKQGHGETWKSLMIQLGLEPKECHKFPLKERKLIESIMKKLADNNK